MSGGLSTVGSDVLIAFGGATGLFLVLFVSRKLFFGKEPFEDDDKGEDPSFEDSTGIRTIDELISEDGGGMFLQNLEDGATSSHAMLSTEHAPDMRERIRPYML